MQIFPIRILLCATFLAGLSVAAQATPVTYDDLNGASPGMLGAQGMGGPSYGEVFQAPSDSLDSWTFYALNWTQQPSTLNFSLYQWDPGTLSLGNYVAGGGLSINPGTTALEPYSITLGAPLIAGQDYLMSVFGSSALNIGETTNSSPLGGGFFYEDSSGGWHSEAGRNLAYTAQFSGNGVPSVPDAGSTLMLLGTGCLGIVLVRSKLSSRIIAQGS